MRVKAVLFDLDNTLYEYEKCNNAGTEAVIDKLSTAFGISKEDVKDAFVKSREKVKEQLKNTGSSHSRFLYLQRTIESLKGSTDVKLTNEIHHVFWGAYFHEMKLFDGVADFFKQLKDSGIKIVIVSNLVADIQFKKLTILGVDNYVDFVVTSEEAGSDKPAKPIFDIALDKLGLQKDDVVLIGDDSTDMEGAKEMGIAYIQLVNGDFGSVMESFKNLNSL